MERIIQKIAKEKFIKIEIEKKKKIAEKILENKKYYEKKVHEKKNTEKNRGKVTKNREKSRKKFTKISWKWQIYCVKFAFLSSNSSKTPSSDKIIESWTLPKESRTQGTKRLILIKARGCLNTVSNL